MRPEWTNNLRFTWFRRNWFSGHSVCSFCPWVGPRICFLLLCSCLGLCYIQRVCTSFSLFFLSKLTIISIQFWKAQFWMSIETSIWIVEHLVTYFLCHISINFLIEDTHFWGRIENHLGTIIVSMKNHLNDIG